ncbi:hypothetical protein ABBQ32_011347 [Trebouxia sp. C0010 RCD-2024]
MLDSLVDEKGRTLKVEIRQSDGYFNATLMCQSIGKQISDWTRQKSTESYQKRLSAIMGIPRVDLVSVQVGGNGERHTWVHRKVAIHLAQWISPDFAVWVTDLVERFITGQITTEQSQAAAQEVSDAIRPNDDIPQVSPQLIQWNRQRDDSRELTKAKSDTLKEVTGGKAHSAYWRSNDAINKAATGKTTKELRVQLGIKKGTPRDRMGAPMLGMIAYQEGMVDKALREAKEDKGDFLKDWEAIGVTETVTDEAEAFCKKTRGFELPMLQYRPPQVKQVQKALQAKKPTMRQQRLITAAMMPILKALPAPPPAQPIDTGDLYD